MMLHSVHIMTLSRYDLPGDDRVANEGFTLIELSIVLVIIGLIVGGVLVGQDLINAARIRSQISQIEKYKTAVNTFLLKFSYLPGDIPPSQAAAFGFGARSGAPGDGDGDGLLCSMGGNCVNGGTLLGAETVMFWEDLTVANLIPGSFTQPDPVPPTSFIGTGPSDYLPTAAIGHGNYIHLYNDGAYNYYMITAVYPLPAFGMNRVTYHTITPMEAYSIDSKIDDGLPQTGTIISLIPYITLLGGIVGFMQVTIDTGQAAGIIAPCSIVGGGAYDTKANANTPACTLSIRF